MYARLNASHYTDGRITQRLVKTLEGEGELNSSLLFNTFENVAFAEPELKLYRDHILKMGADNVHLAGSGPALYSLVKDRASAEDLYNLCQQQGMEAHMVGVGGGRGVERKSIKQA